jgi:Na+-driven multidrug efflux pump
MSDNESTWKRILRAAAPVIGTAWGGPLGGTVATVVSEKILGKPDATETEIAQAIGNGGPEVLAKLKEAELAFTTRMRELDIDVEKIHQADRAAAREREAKTGDTFTPRALAMFVTAGFFGVLGFLLIQGKPQNGGDALLVMLGALGGAWASIISYYFGSSAGSSDKTALLSKQR